MFWYESSLLVTEVYISMFLGCCDTSGLKRLRPLMKALRSLITTTLSWKFSLSSKPHSADYATKKQSPIFAFNFDTKYDIFFTYIAASAMVFIVVPEQLVVDVFETEFRVSCFQFELDISTTDLEQPLPICDVLFSLKYIHNSNSSIREQQLFIWSRRHIISVQKIATRE